MLIILTIRARRAIAGGLLVLLGGCQGFNGTTAGSRPAVPTASSSPIACDTTPQKPITKAQKLEVAMAMARAAENDGNAEQAIQIYRDVIKKDSDHIEAYHRLAIVYDLKGEPLKAREHYMLAIEKAPKNAELYCDFGYSCYLQRNWGEAGVNLRRALELRPDFARAHTNLGLLLAHNYHSSEALAEFSKAGCDEAAARCNLAFVLAVEERCEEARQQYRLALEANPEAPAAKKGLAALETCGRDGDVARMPPANVAPPAVTLQIHAPEGDQAPLPPPAHLAPPPTVQAAFVSPDMQRF